MRRLLSMVEQGRIDLTSLVTHHFTLDQLPEALDLFGRQADGVMKVAIHPAGVERPTVGVDESAATPSR
jgi:threonine dehydrogenase-like Zn-dependent dehydrogenase